MLCEELYSYGLLCSLSLLVQLSYVEVQGAPSGQVQRHLVANCKGDVVVLWWRDTQDGGWNWSSMADSCTENLHTFILAGLVWLQRADICCMANSCLL